MTRWLSVEGLVPFTYKPRGAEPGRVLEAMGLAPRTAGAAVRISLGRGNDERDVERLLDVLPRVVAALRPAAPVASAAPPAALHA